MTASPWTTADIPSQAGRVAVVTGATSGIGPETAAALARAGASVVLAARDPGRGAAALVRLCVDAPDAVLAFEPLDLGDLASVRAFAARVGERHAVIDLLINNAAVMAVPTRRTTADGFELQFGSNYLGHFALTQALLPRLAQTPGARIVNLSSGAHHTGRIDFGNLQSERRYSPWGAYSLSKLAMLMFAFELERRARAAGWTVVGVGAHPGWSITNLQSVGPSMGLGRQSAAERFTRLTEGLFEIRGPPGVARINRKASDTDVAARLWEVSAALTGTG